MAGHSKWANIQHRKGREDAKRAKLFTKLGREITVSARMGGGDPDANPRLRAAMMEARKNSMPNDNIKRAIDKGTGDGDSANMDELVYEGYGPGGIAILVEAMTDNRNRTTPEIRNIFSECGGSLAAAGAVAWQFERKGFITLPKDKPEDEIAEIAIEAGAEDYEDAGESWALTTDAAELHQVREALEGQSLSPDSAKLVQVAQNTTQIEGETLQTVLKLMDLLDDHDDVQAVYNNADFDESAVA